MRLVLQGPIVFVATRGASPGAAPLAMTRASNQLEVPRAAPWLRESIDDVIAAIDIERLPGDQFCYIHSEKSYGSTDLVD